MTPIEKLSFAKKFLKGRVDGQRKDVEICLTGQKVLRSGKETHAYFPAFMITIGFGEMLAGLYAGQLEGNGGRERLQEYFDKFMDRKQYTKDAVAVLYEGFRHKVAHVGHPYGVFDTSTKPKVFPSLRKRFAWSFYASRRSPPVDLVDCSHPCKIKTHATPWDVPYNAKIEVSVRSLSSNLIGSVFKSGGYFSLLKSDPPSLDRFMDCMEHFFPR